FLIDTCSQPVDKLPDRERKRAILDATSRIVQLVSELDPEGIIIVKSNIYEHVKHVLESSGLAARILNQKPLPFPAHARQQSYRIKINHILTQSTVQYTTITPTRA